MIICKSITTFQYDRCYLLLIQYSIAFKIFFIDVFNYIVHCTGYLSLIYHIISNG